MTLQVDLEESAQSYFDLLRNKYFPKHKLKDQAHLSLLYQIHLPEKIIIEKLQQIKLPSLLLEANGVKAFPFGNAIAITCTELHDLHQELKKTFKGKLSRRDFIKFQPHITVQLDVTAFKAQQTYLGLTTEFQPLQTEALGISLWNKDKKQKICLWKSY